MRLSKRSITYACPSPGHPSATEFLHVFLKQLLKHFLLDKHSVFSDYFQSVNQKFKWTNAKSNAVTVHQCGKH